jgi:hypothetical protein
LHLDLISPPEVVTMMVLLFTTCLVGAISGVLLLLSVGMAP